MGKFMDVVYATARVALDMQAKAEDEKFNRQFAKKCGLSEDGLFVAILNESSRRERIKNGRRY